MKALRSILAGSAVAAFAMTSCTADEQISQNTTDGAIRFSVNTANQTRAAHSYCAYEMPDYFNVWADYEKTTVVDGENQTTKIPYIDGDQVNRVGATSKYQPETNRYWPVEKYTFNFYAYVDDDDSFVYHSINSDGTYSPKFENFIVKGAEGNEENTTVEDQLDLMYATECVEQDSEGKYGSVNLNFRHALSQICYKAINENPNIEIIVHSISVSGIAGSGTYIFPTNPTTGIYENHTDDAPQNYPSGLERGEWTNLNNKNTTYKVSFDDYDRSLSVANETYDLTYITHGPDVENEKYYGYVLNLIPQHSDEVATSTDDVFFTLNLTIKNKASQSKTTNGDYFYSTTVVETRDFKVPASFTWEQGNRYIYTFKFAEDWNPNELSKITYSVTTDDFIPTSDIHVPEIAKIQYNKVKMREDPPLYVADRNIGAVSSEDPGMYFEWGHTDGYYYLGNKLIDKNGNIVCQGTDVGMEYFYKGDEYSDDFCNKKLTELYDENRGCITSAEEWQFPVSNYDNSNAAKLKQQYDAAFTNMGEGWRMMTVEDILWLTDNCTWTWIEDGNFTGYEVTPKEGELSNKSIIRIPVMGGLYEGVKDWGMENRPSGNSYWSANPEESNRALELYFTERDETSNRDWWLESSDRFYAFPIRGVSDTE